MDGIILEVPTAHSPESLVEQICSEPGVVLLRSGLFDLRQARYSFVTARPLITLQTWGSRCQIRAGNHINIQFGNPWLLVESLLSRYELLDEVDLPFPLGGCFGYWGYELKNFIEPKLPHRAENDLGLPDCSLGFYSSLVVFDHWLNNTWVVSTGLKPDGSRTLQQRQLDYEFWKQQLTNKTRPGSPELRDDRGSRQSNAVNSNCSKSEFIQRVDRCLRYIRSGDIYQVNVSQRLMASWSLGGWALASALSRVSPAPFSAYLDCGEFQLVSSSPELFLRMSGGHILTRPIKGTRPRSSDPTRDAQLSYELQTSPKEMAELVMIVDLLRNDLGKVCEFGSVQVPELVRLERYPLVQHLVSTVEGRLRAGVTHAAALAACFPGGSITGAPKFRAMEIIDELEPNTRGPYTGVLGYLGFNCESQLSIIIRAALCCQSAAYFHVGAGIVADSVADAEYEETLAKARGFFEALQLAEHAAPVKRYSPPNCASL